MAITETGAIYKALSFDGESSRTYGVYITGEAVYNAPERDIEMISIPGRNGAYSLDKGRFQNIEVTYPAGIFADNETDFRNAISDFRNFLCSKRGYVRLTDEYNPNEYRMAVYKSGLEVEPAMLKAGEFNIVFECKPQRWLTDGETEVTISNTWSNTTTETDSVVEIDNSSGVVGIKDIDIAIEAVQSGSGDPSPDNVRPISGWSNAHVYVGAVSGTADKTYTIDLGGTRYGGTLDVTTGTLTVTHGIVDLGTLTWHYQSAANVFWANYSSMKRPCTLMCSAYVQDNSPTQVENMANHTMWNRGYAYAANNIVIKDTDYTDADLFKTHLSDINAQLVYELVTQTTATLTAEDIELLTGTNYVWADTGDSTIEYGQSPGLITNPTLFESSPLISADGYGSINIGDSTIKILNSTIGTVTMLGKQIVERGNASITTLTISVDYSAFSNVLNQGDTITGATAAFGSIEVINNYPTVYISEIDGVVTSGKPQSVGSPSGTFSFSTTAFPSSNDTQTSTKTVSIKLSNNITFTATATTTLVNRTSGVLSSTVTITTSTDVSAYIRHSVGAVTFQYIYGDSTVSTISSTTHIDCDIGEAYKIENGEFVSMNSSVSIPSELPTLASGANTITFDNTITDLKIVPRWWKV